MPRDMETTRYVKYVSAYVVFLVCYTGCFVAFWIIFGDEIRKLNVFEMIDKELAELRALEKQTEEHDIRNIPLLPEDLDF